MKRTEYDSLPFQIFFCAPLSTNGNGKLVFVPVVIMSFLEWYRGSERTGYVVSAAGLTDESRNFRLRVRGIEGHQVLSHYARKAFHTLRE